MCDFIKGLPGCSDYVEDFAVQEIDGQALMLLQADHLMTAMSIKLGPALKICEQVKQLKDELNKNWRQLAAFNVLETCTTTNADVVGQGEVDNELIRSKKCVQFNSTGWDGHNDSDSPHWTNGAKAADKAAVPKILFKAGSSLLGEAEFLSESEEENLVMDFSDTDEWEISVM